MQEDKLPSWSIVLSLSTANACSSKDSEDLYVPKVPTKLGTFFAHQEDTVKLSALSIAAWHLPEVKHCKHHCSLFLLAVTDVQSES